MENFDFGRAINIFLVAFVIFIAIMIAFVARLVSTFMVRNHNANLTATYAKQEEPIETPLEVLHTTTISLDNISEDYLNGTDEGKHNDYEVLLTYAQARKQALNSVIEENPVAIFSSIFPQEKRNKLPREVQIFIESDVIMEGRLKATEIQDQVSKLKERRFSLVARNGEEFMLYFTEKTPAPVSTSGLVRIQGILIDNKVVVESIKEISM